MWNFTYTSNTDKILQRNNLHSFKQNTVVNEALVKVANTKDKYLVKLINNMYSDTIFCLKIRTNNLCYKNISFHSF